MLVKGATGNIYNHKGHTLGHPYDCRCHNNWQRKAISRHNGYNQFLYALFKFFWLSKFSCKSGYTIQNGRRDARKSRPTSIKCSVLDKTHYIFDYFERYTVLPLYIIFFLFIQCRQDPFYLVWDISWKIPIIILPPRMPAFSIGCHFVVYFCTVDSRRSAV